MSGYSITMEKPLDFYAGSKMIHKIVSDDCIIDKNLENRRIV